MGYNLRTDMNVYLPGRATHWVGEPTYKPITMIKMMCASVFAEYVERRPFINYIEDKFIEVKKVEGGTSWVNTQYIVSFEDFDLCICEYSDEWGRGPIKMQFLVRPGEKVVLHDDIK